MSTEKWLPGILEKRLKDHDWWHDYSDDNRAAIGGMMDKKQILDQLTLIPMREAVELISTYVPKEPLDVKADWMKQLAMRMNGVVNA